MERWSSPSSLVPEHFVSPLLGTALRPVYEGARVGVAVVERSKVLSTAFAVTAALALSLGVLRSLVSLAHLLIKASDCLLCLCSFNCSLTSVAAVDCHPPLQFDGSSLLCSVTDHVIYHDSGLSPKANLLLELVSLTAFGSHSSEVSRISCQRCRRRPFVSLSLTSTEFDFLASLH